MNNNTEFPVKEISEKLLAKTPPPKRALLLLNTMLVNSENDTLELYSKYNAPPFSIALLLYIIHN